MGQTRHHHRRKQWHIAAVRRTKSRRPSVHLASIVLQVSNSPTPVRFHRSQLLPRGQLGVRRLCLLSRAAATQAIESLLLRGLKFFPLASRSIWQSARFPPPQSVLITASQSTNSAAAAAVVF
ncbi:uncharacterized protein DS421_2g39440 [Arachis hypogaea]|nr:uncharacterized protein DS421_2g39440 [Arachis hypogaea]